MDSINPPKRIKLGEHQTSSEIEKEGDFARKKVKTNETAYNCSDKESSVTVNDTEIHNRVTEALPDSALEANPEKGIYYFEKMPIEERYRFLVDGKLLQEESGASLFEAREPGCLIGGARAYKEILSSLRCCASSLELLDKDYLKNLHRLLFEPTRLATHKGRTKKLKSAGKFRTKRVFIRVSSNFTEKGLLEAQEFYKKISPDEKNIFQVAVYKSSSPDARKIEQRVYPDARDVPKYAQDKRCTVDFRPVQHEVIEAAVDDLLSNAREKLKCLTSKSELISFLAELSTKLDQVHPFENGNVRIIRGLIDSILMYYGFCPIIWNDPNIIDFYDTNKITEVMEATLLESVDLIQALSAGEKIVGIHESSREDKDISLAAFSKQDRT